MAPPFASTARAESWSGALFGPGPAQAIELVVGEGGGTIGFVHDDAYGVPLQLDAWGPERVHFTVTMPDRGPVTFAGSRDGDLITGEVEDGVGAYDFHLFRIEDRATESLQDCLGWYRAPGGSSRFITLDPYGGLAFVDFDAWQDGYLIPVNGSVCPQRDDYAEWESSPPLRRWWCFQRDDAGAVIGYVITKEDGDTETARRFENAPFRQELVRFANGDIELAGLLLIPTVSGPHPAVVMMPGSGHQTRERSRELVIAARMIEAGFAVLTYDKRGSGLSGGHWHQASIDDLAGDALAGVSFLQRHAGIDPDRIGLYGMSQGGHLTPFAANRSDAVRFIIDDSGGAGPLAEAELHAVAERFRSAGFGEGDVNRAVEMARLRFDAMLSDDAAGRYEKALEAASGAKWLDPEYLGPLRVPGDHWKAVWWRGVLRERSREAWRSLRVPALVLYGSKDRLVPVEEDAAFLRKEAPLAKVVVFPEAGHGIRQSGGEGGFAPGYFDEIQEWLRQH